jgi:hypothetical protein
MTASATKRCLNVPELLGSILASLDKPTQASMALCCRAFLTPAVEALWDELNSLVPLIKTFPNDVWTDEDDTVMDDNGIEVPLVVSMPRVFKASMYTNSLCEVN